MQNFLQDETKSEHSAEPVRIHPLSRHAALQSYTLQKEIKYSSTASKRAGALLKACPRFDGVAFADALVVAMDCSEVLVVAMDCSEVVLVSAAGADVFAMALPFQDSSRAICSDVMS